MMKSPTSNFKEQISMLEKMSDKDINYDDIPDIESRPERFTNPTRGKFYRPVKVQKTLRIDADVLEQFESLGKGYQTEINAVLRNAVIPSIFIFEELRKEVRNKNYVDFSNLVNAYIAIKPESRNFIKNSARAIVIGEYLKHEQASDFTALVKVISKEPIWWVALKENAAEPLVYPNVVRVAYAKFKEYLNAGKSTKKLLSPSKAA